MSSARRFDSLCDTPFHTVTIGVNVVSTECLRGFRYVVNFVDGNTSLHCLFMWTKNEVTTKLEEFISDFLVALDGALAVFLRIWVARSTTNLETVASLGDDEKKVRAKFGQVCEREDISSCGHLRHLLVCRK